MSWLSSIFHGTPAGQIPGTKNPFAPPDLSFLKNKIDLTSGFKPIKNNDALFNDLIGNINAPSSVDQVQSQVDSDRMKQLLEGIGIDEKNVVGGTKSDFLDRGLGGPGQISDIEANALAQNRYDANRLRSGARTEFANSELGRLKAREEAARGAYGARYEAGNTANQTNAHPILGVVVSSFQALHALQVNTPPQLDRPQPTNRVCNW